MQTPPPHSGSSSKLSAAARAHLLGEVAALAGAALQKLWLVSPSLLVLQLRVPGRTLLVQVDAALALASVVAQRPAVPEGAPKSQATLRSALEGTRFDGLRLEVPREAPPEARAAALRLFFGDAEGRKSLLADPKAAALVVLAQLPGDDAEAAKVIWAGAGAAPTHRPGALLAPARPIELGTATSAQGEGHAEATQAAAQEARRELEAQASAALETARQAALRGLRARLKKVERTLENVEADAARAGAAADDLRKAELLLPFQSKVPRGASTFSVPDWSQLDGEGRPKQIALQLDPALSAAANCARWLKRSQRYGKAQERIAARRAEVEQQAEALRGRISEVERAPDLAALRAPLAEAARAGGETVLHGKRRGPGERLPFRTFRTAAGARVLVGRSAKDNDALTFQRARGNDLWLHVRGVQGSHVVVPDPGEAPAAETLLDAALLAAWFSSARGEEQCEVSWTRKKHVRKPRGGGPGAVLYTQEKTLRLRHDRARLEALLAREE
jgi:NFACT N-terminal and middle domains/NFACT protein RNA binding domain